jgi:hypothetical protein
MTTDPKALADAIDPRLAVSPEFAAAYPEQVKEGRWCNGGAVLMAAADYIRAQASPPADVMEVVKKLRDIADDYEPHSTMAKALYPAADLLLSLSLSTQQAQDCHGSGGEQGRPVV